MQVKTYLDYSKNEIRNVALQCLASAPVNPVQGQIYYNISDDLVYVFDTEWKAIGEGTRGVQTFVQNTEPQDAQIGDIWVNPDETTSITDYIVEEGTSGIWTYRKWNSGIAECWGKTTTNYAISTTMGSIYYGTYISYDYPTGLFIAEPSCHFDTSNNSPNANFTWVIAGRGGTEARTANIYIASATSRSANDITISVSAKGRWK